ncbi:hypothetical protein B4U79_16342 [Dinothrombium tinctorium]|uniref:F-box domain-containing protein n=1 Tax=Dinothrombium tinctorium TaxID=1965070 RepID=A0A3S3NDX2_9ACAR|nr:hypothetical protein B4U79_16865 [Dinothrombium tinctorium]RWS00505.1 hypothetical protein B4U79_16860 [Dinothrombium tinctorium]RWS00728.1 hypothetical protein B4U79_16829 [Dinothrombium tinctorium]RWS05160.1 hypothetical protein B4U79_16342 [Dinothrombium tinctorium]
MAPNFEDLADDVLLNIISFVAYKDIYSLSLVSNRFRTLCKQQVKYRSLLVDSTENGFKLTQRTYRRTVFDSNEAINVRYEKLLDVFITHLPNIRTLCLHEVDGITDENVHLIALYLPNLSYLWLYRLYRHLTDKGLQQLFPLCRNLQKLALHFLDINGSCFNEIPQVKYLSISSHWNLDTGSCLMLCNRLRNSLERFCLDNLHGIEILKNLLKRITNLKAVEITIHKSADFVPFLKEISSNGSIEELSLNIIAEVNGENVNSIAVFENVMSVSLAFDNRISDEDLMRIIERFPNVKELNLTLTDEGYYGSLYRDEDPENILPEYSRTIDTIKHLQCLQTLNLFFDKCNRFKTHVDRYCRSIFDSDCIQHIKFGLLDQDELNALLAYLNDTLTQHPERQLQIELYTFAKESNVVCDLSNLKLKVFRQQDKEEREMNLYSSSNNKY